jgi:hypothetical protein
MARFDRDVLNQAGVKYVILLEGVNDLGTLTRDQPVSPEAHAALVARMIASYDQMIRRARERGIKIYGATVMPYGGSGYYHPDAVNEQDRQAINAWIRDARPLRRGDRLRQADGAIRPIPASCRPPTTPATACIPPWPATRPWPTRCRWTCSRTEPFSSRPRPLAETDGPRAPKQTCNVLILASL